MSTVGTARITIEADTSKLADTLTKQLQTISKKIDTVLQRLPHTAGKAGSEMASKLADATNTGGKRAGDNLARGVTTGAKKADTAVNTIGRGGMPAVATAARNAASSLTGIGTTARRAASDTASSFRTGASTLGSTVSTGAQRAGAALSGITTSASRVASNLGSVFNSSVGSIRASMSRVGEAATQAGTTVRDKLAGAFKTSSDEAARVPSMIGKIGIAFATVAGPAAVLKSGFTRLMDIQRAEIGFKNIGLSAQETKTHMQRLADQVTGTSVSLSDAAKYSAMFAQSGVDMGKPMDDTVKAFTNLSAAASGSGVDVGNVMTQISAAGRLLGGDAMQLQQAGINIYQYVADYMGKSVDEVKKLGEQGKITFDDVVNAINHGMGDYAKEMGETLPAKLGNLRTAIANLGANLIEPFIPALTAAVEFGTALVKNLVQPLKKVAEWFQQGGIAADVLKVALTGIGTALTVAGISGFVRAFFDLSKAIQVLNLGFLATPWGMVIAALGAVVAGFVLLWKRSEAFREFWIGLWEQVKHAVSGVGEFVQGVWDRVGDGFTVLGEHLSGVFTALRDAWATLWGALTGGDGRTSVLEEFAGSGLARTLVGVFTTAGDAARLLWGVIQDLGGALIGIGSAIGQASWGVLTAAFEAVWSIGSAVVDVAISLGKALWGIVEALAPILLPVLKVLGIILGGVLVAAVFGFVGALKITAVILQGLAAVIRWVADTLIGPLISAIGTVVAWLVHKLGGAVTAVISWFGDLVGWLVDHVPAAFNAIRDAIGVIVDWFGSVFSAIWDGLRAAWETLGAPVIRVIGDAFLIGFGLIVLAVEKLRGVWDTVWAGLAWVWGTLISPLLDAIAAGFHALWDGVTVVFGWIVDGWNTAWDVVRAVYDTVIAPVLGWVADRFAQLRDGVRAAMDAISGAVHAAGQTIRSLYDTYVAPMVSSVRGGFDRAVHAVAGFKDRVVGVMRDAGSWLLGAGRAIADGLINGIKAMFAPVANAAASLGEHAKNAAKRVLGIHSPSRVFHEIGENIGEGMIAGIDATHSGVAAATSQLGETAASAAPRTTGIPVATPEVGAPLDIPTQPLIDGAGAIANATTNTWIPAVDTAAAHTQQLGVTVEQQTTGVITPAFTTMATGVAGMVSGTLNPALAAANTAVTTTGGVFTQQVLAVITPVLRQLVATLWWTITSGVTPVFQSIRGSMSWLVSVFQWGVSNIAAQWARIREAAAAPVRFTIGTVFNNGLVGMWNSVAELLGVRRMAAYPLRFATGGYVTGPGGPRDDRVPALLSNGEYVINAKAVDQIGVNNLHALNSGAVAVAPGVFRDKKQRESLLQDATFTALAARYAGGGIVKGSKAWNQLRRGYLWAQKLSGRPYVLGGDPVGGGGTDCSGYMSSIADRIQGGPGHRRWATMAFNGGGNRQMGSGPQGFVAGLARGFAIGVTNGGAAGGHTAGTIGGVEAMPAVNVESGGSPSRVKFGAGAVGADHSQFRTRYHLPLGFDGGFVTGGTSGVSLADMVTSAVKPHVQKIRAWGSQWAGKPGVVNQIPRAVGETLTKAARTKIDRLAEQMLQSGGDPGGAGVERWAPLVMMLLRRYGFPASWKTSTLRRMNQESGGNPRAINNWDVNAKNGDPSKGLMQVIGSTFRAYRDPAFPNDIWHPTANIAASMRYAMARYGSLPAAYDRAGGYHDGGVMGAGRGWFHKTAFAPERVLSPQQTESFDRLIDWLDRNPQPRVRPQRADTLYGYDPRVTRQVMVTQNISGGDAKTTADAVQDRLLALMV